MRRVVASTEGFSATVVPTGGATSFMPPARNLSNTMTPSAPVLSSYDRRTIALHWLTAALVIGLWLLGQTIDWFPKGTPRAIARSTHIALGLGLAVVLARRIWWRLGGGVHLPQEGGSLLDTIASLTHKILYLLVVGTVLLGIANAWIRGDTLFTIVKIPSLAPGNTALRKLVEDWHSWAADILLIVAGLHATAGLLHHYVLRDGILRRMLPRR